MSQAPEKLPLKFSDLKLPALLQEVIAEIGYTTLTPVQAQSIPLLLAGRDLIGQSRTGSGKTAAFSIPILRNVNVKTRVVQALVLCPTRELCAQVAREMRRLGRRHPGLQVLICSGGQFIAPQIGALEKGAHIVVGTPGRVLDLISRKKLVLGKTTTLVLDEADRMLDMGFQDDMEQILAALPRQCQTVFFSATFPDSIDEMSRKYQRNPARVTIETREDEVPAIQEIFHEAERDQKATALARILKHHDPESAIVFVNMKAVAQEVAAELEKSGISAAALHGDLEQFDRDRVMARFRNHSVRVLVATDVAARGIDVEALDLVVNFDCPAKPDVYVHRIGRTGRAGKTGVAISIITPKEQYKLELISEYTRRPAKASALPCTSISGRASEAPAAAKKAVTSSARMETISISAGRKDKLRPGDILGALTGEAGGLKGDDVGKIEIHDRISYVAVRKEVAQHALRSLEKGKIKGRTFRVSLV
jgi:ATP-independent RNA helicase DbpA